MRMMVKLFGCILFASFAASLQAFTVENRSLRSVTIFVFELRRGNNFIENRRIKTPKKVVIRWADKSRKEKIDLMYKTFMYLESGQIAEITMVDSTQLHHVCACFLQKCYCNHFGWEEIRETCAYCVSPNDEFVIEEETKLLQTDDNDDLADLFVPDEIIERKH